MSHICNPLYTPASITSCPWAWFQLSRYPLPPSLPLILSCGICSHLCHPLNLRKHKEQRAAEGDHECPVSIPCKPYCATWTIPIHLALLFFLAFLPKKTDPKFNICNPWSVCVYTEVGSVSHPATLAWKLSPKLHVTLQVISVYIMSNKTKKEAHHLSHHCFI